MLFAHLKRILKLDRLRLRGISGARDEFLMAAAAQNLRRTARWLMPATVELSGCAAAATNDREIRIKPPGSSSPALGAGEFFNRIGRKRTW